MLLADSHLALRGLCSVDNSLSLFALWVTSPFQQDMLQVPVMTPQMYYLGMMSSNTQTNFWRNCEDFGWAMANYLCFTSPWKPRAGVTISQLQLESTYIKKTGLMWTFEVISKKLFHTYGAVFETSSRRSALKKDYVLLSKNLLESIISQCYAYESKLTVGVKWRVYYPELAKNRNYLNIIDTRKRKKIYLIKTVQLPAVVD